jgi:hypothetical protein
MSEQPLFTSPGITITRQMVSINGRTFAVGQIASVGLRTHRKRWRTTLLWGLVLLGSIALLFTLNVGCVSKPAPQCSQSSMAPVSLLVAIYSFVGGAAGVIVTAVGSIQVLYGMLNPRAGNFLEIGTSDGRIHQIKGLSSRNALAVESAMTQAIASR